MGGGSSFLIGVLLRGGVHGWVHNAHLLLTRVHFQEGAGLSVGHSTHTQHYLHLDTHTHINSFSSLLQVLSILMFVGGVIRMIM